MMRINPPPLIVKPKANLKPELNSNNYSSNSIEISQRISPKPSTSSENHTNLNIENDNTLQINKPLEERIVEDDSDPKPENRISENSLISEILGDSSSPIKPTKTKDITKIKGWRGKQFLKTNSNSQFPTVSIDKPIDDKSMDLPETLEISTKSAFESEALDKFLTNAKLNISYEVPKLIAEESISKIDHFKVMSSQNANPTVKSIAKNSDKKCKAKTLAEKRKMIENDRQKDLLHEMEINETTLLKQLKRDEKRHRIETINEIRDTLKNQSMPITRECWKTAMKNETNQSASQVITNNNEIIQITGSFDDVAIRLTENLIRTENKNLYYQNVQIVDEISFKEIKPNYKAMFSDSGCKYKPGPLCKKPFLDQLKNSNWETVVVSLPKVFLQVHSECGKEMDPKIRPYVQTEVSEKGFISDLWANFAASAVIQDNKNIFDFPLKYSNDQHKVLMKRKKIVKSSIFLHNTKDDIVKDEKLEENSADKSSVESQVKSVMDSILKYLETPVLDNANINYCPDCPKFEESNSSFLPVTQVSDDVHAILSTSRKRKLPSLLKTERELKRLSVQVIEVDMQPEKKAKRIKNENCMKAECRMGCVCYDSGVEWPQHCGREDCMLQCQCRSIKISDKQRGHQYITLPEGSNILSAKTMGHIRDQAHKNLAKEERKFTQTVIKANDQTIVVGDGCRERRKRVKKIPQKYTEYVKNCAELKKIHNFEAEVPEKPKTRRSLRIWGQEEKSNQSSEDLSVPINFKNDLEDKPPVTLKQEIIPILENMIQLKNVLPWCMIHNLYKCFCNGHALEDILTQKTKKIVNTEKEEENDNEEYISYTSKRTYAAANPFANSEINVSARIRGVPNFYLNRNKSQYFKTRNIEIRDKEKDYNYFTVSTLDDSSKDSLIEIRKTQNPVKIKFPHSSESIEKLDKIETETLEKTKNKNETEITDNTRSIRKKTLSRKYSSSEFIAELPKIIDTEKSLSKKSKSSSIIENKTSKALENKITKSAESKTIKSAESKITRKETKKDNIKQLKLDKKVSKSLEKNNLHNTDVKQSTHMPQSDPKKSLLLSKTFMLPNLLIPMPHIQNHFRSMVFKTASNKHIFRLMQWEKLNEQFQKSSIYIWYNPKGVGGKLIATKSALERPSENYINVKYFKNMTTELPDVVKGLIQGKLPGVAFDAKNTYGIFVFNGQFWEIRGTILKKPTDSPIIKEDEIIKENELDFPDVSNPIKELHLESKEVPLTVAEPALKSDTASPASIRVPIPVGTKDSRWFMLILENDFSVLRVANSTVTIKYAQLKQACQFAMRVSRTVRFLIPRNNKLEDNNNPAYGGYAVPGLLERIFFGPYDLVEGHGIMTYRYLNGKLVDTKLVDHLTGTNSKKSKGIWLYTKGGQMTEMSSLSQDTSIIPTVDLTENDEGENEILNQNWDSIEENKSNAPDTVLTNILNSAINVSCTLLSSKSSSNQISMDNNLTLKKYSNNEKPELTSNKKEVSMPKLEKIDSKINVSKSTKEMPTLQPIASSSAIETLNDSNSKELINSLPIYYNSRRNPTIKPRRRKAQLQEICNDDDLEIISTTISTKPKERTMWLVSEPKNLGYIEIKTHVNGRIGLKSPINQQEIEFNEMSAAIDWIDKLLRRFVHFVPIDFQIRMFLVEDEKALTNRQPLKETELRGHHVICKKGLFDLTELTSNDIDDLGISIRERDKLLERQATLVLQKYIYKLGDTFLPVETMRSMLHETIINMASPAIRRLQKENIKLKKEKRDCLLENQRLKKKFNELSRPIDKNNKSSTFGVDAEYDDDVILIEDDDGPPKVAKDINKDPLEFQQDNNLVISNVTSLAENFIDNNPSDPLIIESITESCKIVDGIIQKNSEPSQSKSTPNNNKRFDPNKLPVTTPDTTKAPVYAPVVLPDGRSIYIPIEPANKNRKIVVSDNQSKKYRIKITPVASPPPLKTRPTKPSKSISNNQSLLKNHSKNSEKPGNDTNKPIIMSEVIEID
ncbi:uncharacterized protein LOC123292665 [Chrysoperla carnea]|uniref:uncharacterized protein LOC123292665 n=1 Tax=Chrysoperla carnea TaxID=189513 RepID=UPI001D08B4AC|nr:uncharacterized protein LOC123292665 [Chrysoperla carnea]